MYYGINFSPPPQCSMFGRYQQKNGWDHGGRTLDSDLLIFVISGSASFRFLKTIYQVTTGDWLLIPKGEHYSANTSDFCEYYFFHFHAVCESLEQKPPSDFQPQPNYSICPVIKASETVYLTEKLDSGEELTELMRISGEMHRLILRTSIGERLLFDQYFGQLILLLSLRVSVTICEETPALLRQAVIYIQNNYTQPLSLTDLSVQLQVSKSYLLRLFRKHLGMTATTYINSVKLEHAAQLLRTSRMNVTQTADYLGYSDSGYFSRLFQKRFGVRPSKFAQWEK